MSKGLNRLAVASAIALLAAAPAAAQLAPIPQDRGGNGLGLALRRIGVTPRVLYVTAHPDDEHNGMLVRLSRGLGVRTALLTMTRGDGGQNAVGSELFEGLAVLRAEELAAVHRYDAVEQYFGLSSDFGYSFSVEETLERWGREAALGDVVRVVRSFRPDVIVTLPIDTVMGGLHHQAAGRLALEAFRAAADPSRFPEIGPGPWQARKIYEGGVGGGGSDAAGRVRVRTGVYDPLLGMSWQQLGTVARSHHRSQSMGQLMAPPGVGEASFALLDSEPRVTPPEGDILDGFELTFAGLLRFAPAHETDAPFLRADLQALQARADAARAAFDPAAGEQTLPSLQAALLGARALADRVRASALPETAREALADRLLGEAADVESALRLAHGLDVESLAADDAVIPGQTFVVTTRVSNQGGAPVAVEEIELRAPQSWSVRAATAEAPAARSLARGETATVRHEVAVAADAPPSQPHWRRTQGKDRFELLDASPPAAPWPPPLVTARVRYRSAEASSEVTAPAQFRYAWPGGGEKQKLVAVAPEFSVRLEPEVTVVPIGSRAPRELRVSVQNERKGPAEGRARLEVPAGWGVEPREAVIRFRNEGEQVAARFVVTPGPVAAAETSIRAVFVDEGGRRFDTGAEVIAYEHVLERRLIRPAAARVIALEVATAPGVSVGYVDGAGDDLDSAIRQLGVPLIYLTADDLAFGDLDRFTTIVTGTRAYEVRADLRSFHHRLMAYVERGGNLVVQYNRPAVNTLGPAVFGAPPPASSPWVPFPAVFSGDRVTDERAAPTVLAPDSPLLSSPNRIEAGDWAGWVQERGLNFLAARDPRYADVVAFGDPFPLNPGEKRGALVEAPVGRGRWTYLGLGLFRQLPAGVPGAYRLLANLVSRPRGR